jgi:hypothetical protein
MDNIERFCKNSLTGIASISGNQLNDCNRISKTSFAKSKGNNLKAGNGNTISQTLSAFSEKLFA